jgi:hypothetical protein
MIIDFPLKKSYPAAKNKIAVISYRDEGPCFGHGELYVLHDNNSFTSARIGVK